MDMSNVDVIVSSAWENMDGPQELLFSEIEVCPIDDHLTSGVIADIIP